jgi:hypothetical protein
MPIARNTTPLHIDITTTETANVIDPKEEEERGR